MSVTTCSGTKLYIGSAMPATLDEAGYTAVGITYTEVEEITNFGEIAQGYTPVDYNNVATRITKTLKGNKINGELQLNIGRDVDATGQAAVIAALNSDNNYPFKIVTPDTTAFYFIGAVMSANLNLGEGNNVIARGVNIKLNSDILEVQPE